MCRLDPWVGVEMEPPGGGVFAEQTPTVLGVGSPWTPGLSNQHVLLPAGTQGSGVLLSIPGVISGDSSALRSQPASWPLSLVGRSLNPKHLSCGKLLSGIKLSVVGEGPS